MTQEIFDYIYKLQIPEKMANKIRRFKYNMDYKDYIQDMYLILLELDNNKIEKLYNKGNKELANYFAKICLNQLTKMNSQWHKKIEGKVPTVSFDSLIAAYNGNEDNDNFNYLEYLSDAFEVNINFTNALIEKQELDYENKQTEE